MNTIINKIEKLKKDKNAIILAHFYQSSEIQEIADFVGDSLALAQQAQKTNANIIVFAGVHFMAETAKILNPSKIVLVPDMDAGCSLADSCPDEKFKEFLKMYPNHIVITYINASAAVKELSDIIVTSSNAVKIVNTLPVDAKIVFAPDKNLGSYINAISKRNMVLWDGSCHVHDQLKAEYIINLKKMYPDAKIIAHPECKSIILELADFIGSTNALLAYTISDNSQRYIVATESGILHQMKKNSPHKNFIIVPADKNCNCNDCSFMKLNTLQKIYDCLNNEKPFLSLSDETIRKASIPLLRMLELS